MRSDDSGTGTPGQNRDNPASIFDNHQWVDRTGFFDPSYGATYSSDANFVATSISGYSQFDTAYVFDETVENVDLNGNGNKLDSIVVTAMLAKP